MNTVLSRANSLFAFSLSVMAALTFGCFITTAFKDRRVPVDIHVSRVMLKNVDDFTGPRERSDLGFITFDLSADIKPIFDWNVKQLFLYLSAEYATKSNVSVLQRVYTLRLATGTVDHLRNKRGGTYLHLSNRTLSFRCKLFSFSTKRFLLQNVLQNRRDEHNPDLFSFLLSYQLSYVPLGLL
uniref:Signal peptidase complex subunit 3 n=1 Tax=Oncorhynchus tshawytscha TaxID=74940 RepID=A0AAZ3Q1R2_ONCTS